jgi:hypothetical protein
MNPAGGTAGQNKGCPDIGPRLPLPRSPVRPLNATEAAAFIRRQLDQILRDADARGSPEHETVAAVIGWAAERSYRCGGYGRVRVTMLNALEEILLREMQDKNAA